MNRIAFAKISFTIYLKTGFTQIKTCAYLFVLLPLTHPVITKVVAIGLGHVVKFTVYIELIAKSVTEIGYNYNVVIVGINRNLSEVAVVDAIDLDMLFFIILVDKSRLYNFIIPVCNQIYFSHKIFEMSSNSRCSTTLSLPTIFQISIAKNRTKRFHTLPFVLNFNKFIDNCLANHANLQIFDLIDKTPYFSFNIRHSI